jgi:hypothetical protein
MKQTITESQFRDAFHDIRPNNFSYAALGELYEWLEQYEEDTETEVELDVIAICCDFSEYTLEELQNDYGYMDEDSKEWDLDEWAEFLNDHTIVIPVSYHNSIVPELDTESLIIQAF